MTREDSAAACVVADARNAKRPADHDAADMGNVCAGDVQDRDGTSQVRAGEHILDGSVISFHEGHANRMQTRTHRSANFQRLSYVINSGPILFCSVDVEQFCPLPIDTEFQLFIFGNTAKELFGSAAQ